MALNERRRGLLIGHRWRPLGAFVERWYARSLSDEDGYTPSEIEEIQRARGMRLPAALAEWYELVGRRLRHVQDYAVALRDLEIADRSIPLWRENQGVWSLHTPIDGDDPMTFTTGDAVASDAPVSQAMLGMLVSETLFAAWSCSSGCAGALGELAVGVRGGYCDSFTDAVERKVCAAFPPLGFVPSPHVEATLRGNDVTVIRPSGVSIEWMTATDDAFTALNDVVELHPSARN